MFIYFNSYEGKVDQLGHPVDVYGMDYTTINCLLFKVVIGYEMYKVTSPFPIKGMVKSSLDNITYHGSHLKTIEILRP